MTTNDVLNELKKLEIKPEDYSFRAFPVAGKFQGRLVRREDAPNTRHEDEILITVMTTGREIFTTEVEALLAVRKQAKKIKLAYTQWLESRG